MYLLFRINLCACTKDDSLHILKCPVIEQDFVQIELDSKPTQVAAVQAVESVHVQDSPRWQGLLNLRLSLHRHL